MQEFIHVALADLESVSGLVCVMTHLWVLTLTHSHWPTFPTHPRHTAESHRTTICCPWVFPVPRSCYLSPAGSRCGEGSAADTPPSSPAPTFPPRTRWCVRPRRRRPLPRPLCYYGTAVAASSGWLACGGPSCDARKVRVLQDGTARGSTEPPDCPLAPAAPRYHCRIPPPRPGRPTSNDQTPWKPATWEISMKPCVFYPFLYLYPSRGVYVMPFGPRDINDYIISGYSVYIPFYGIKN